MEVFTCKLLRSTFIAFLINAINKSRFVNFAWSNVNDQLSKILRTFMRPNVCKVIYTPHGSVVGTIVSNRKRPIVMNP